LGSTGQFRDYNSKNQEVITDELFSRRGERRRSDICNFVKREKKVKY